MSENTNINQSKHSDLKLDDSKTNGLITKIWGPYFWETLHIISFGYPLEPTDEHKKNYREFYVSVRNVLPCKYCRESFTKFVLEDLDTKLLDEDLKSRESLSRWVYKLHNRVNKKIGMDYNVTYDDIIQKYESMRAICVPKAKSCSMPLDLKAKSYHMAEIKHAPVMKEDYFDTIKIYAKIRGIKFQDSIKKLNKLRRNEEYWLLRDKYCWGIINKMRKYGIPSVELDGPFKKLPTIMELKLMKMMSTTICCEEIKKICDNIKELFLK